MKHVGIVVHEGRPAARRLAAELTDSLRRAGAEVRVAASDAPFDPSFAVGLDLVVTLGGDGTILHTAALVCPNDVPLLGVNFGQLGYLTVVEPADAEAAVDRFLAGDHDVESRMLLEVTVRRGDDRDLEPDEPADGTTFLALNEVVLERPVTASTIRVEVAFDGRVFTTYAADGLIVATPTGSTAYAFSVRGPIVDASHRALVLTPISPHMLFDRSLVFGPETSVQLTVVGDRPGSLSVDGRRLGTLRGGDGVSCRASERSLRLVTFGPRDFHAVLKAKFGLNDR